MKELVEPSGGRHGCSVAPQPDAAAGSRVFDREVEPMQLCDGGDETEAEAAARRMPALLDPMEAPQHRITLGFGNAGTRVAHFDAEPVARLECTQGNATSSRRELDRVIDKVADRFEHQARVAGNLNAAVIPI